MKKKSSLGVAIIGLGAWGPNHVRSFSQLAQVRGMGDVNGEVLETMKNHFPGIQATTDMDSLFRNPEIDAVVVATPTHTHYELVKSALLHKKHVLCEKPLSLSYAEAMELTDLAKKQDRVLMVGFVFLFNNGITAMKRYLSEGALGAIHYAHSERTNFGPIRYDVNAAWDLASHDIAIFNYLFEKPPRSVSARGGAYLSENKEDVVFITLEYSPKILVNIHVSWLDPKKVREITLIGDKKMLSWSDLDNVGPIRIYDKSVEPIHQKFIGSYGEFRWVRFDGNLTIPNIAVKEPLMEQALAFIDTVLTQKETAPFAGAKKASWVTRILEGVDASLKNQGSIVRFDESDF